MTTTIETDAAALSVEGRQKTLIIADALKKDNAKRSFVEFLKYVYIQEPYQQASGNVAGKVKFEMWPHLEELALEIGSAQLIEVLKARQNGFSWLLAAVGAWFMAFYPASNGLLLSKGEVEAWSLLRKVRFVYKNLPKSWNVPILDIDSRSEMSYTNAEGIVTRIEAGPSTEDAGRSESYSWIGQDEADYHKYLESSMAAVKPTIDMGGMILMGSTSNKREVSSLFKAIYRGAPANHWKTFFWPWDARPGRDAAWYQRTKETIPLEELQDMSPDFFMEQEYPATPEEALSPARASSYFDQGMLTAMDANTYSPIAIPIDDNYRKVLNFYVARHPRGRYAAGTDIAHGKGRDYSVTVIIDLEAGRVVADIMENTLRPDEFVEESIKLLKLYNCPMWGIEVNEIGDEAVNAALDQNYPKNHLYFKELAKNNKNPAHKSWGWYTDRMSRPRVWGKLREWVDTGQLQIPSKVGLSQFFTVLFDEKNKRPEAMLRANDDYPMAVGIALQMEDYVRVSRKKLAVVGATW